MNAETEFTINIKRDYIFFIFSLFQPTNARKICLQNSVEPKRSERCYDILSHLIEQNPFRKEKFCKFLLDCVGCGVAEGKISINGRKTGMKRKIKKLNWLLHVPYSGSLYNSIAASTPLTLSTAPSRTVFCEGMLVFTVSYSVAAAKILLVFSVFTRIFSVILAFFSFFSLSRNQ